MKNSRAFKKISLLLPANIYSLFSMFVYLFFWLNVYYLLNVMITGLMLQKQQKTKQNPPFISHSLNLVGCFLT